MQYVMRTNIVPFDTYAHARSIIWICLSSVNNYTNNTPMKALPVYQINTIKYNYSFPSVYSLYVDLCKSLY